MCTVVLTHSTRAKLLPVIYLQDLMLEQGMSTVLYFSADLSHKGKEISIKKQNSRAVPSVVCRVKGTAFQSSFIIKI